MNRRVNDTRKGESGAAMVEFGIVSVLFFTLVFAIIQGGIIFGSWIVVTNAVREGARWGSPCITRAELPSPYGASCAGDWSDPAVTIANYTKSKIAWPDPDSASWGMTFTVTIDDITADPRLVHVRVDYAVPLFVPLIGVPVSNPLPLFAESDMRVEK